MRINIRFEFHIHIYKSNDDQLKEKTCKELTGECFLKRAEQEVEAMKSIRSHSTIANYRCALNAFRRYLGQDLPTDKINSDTIRGFEQHLRMQKVSPNSSSCYMRSLRALIIRLKGESAKTLFHKVYTGKAKTDKRAVSESDIHKLKSLRLKRLSCLRLARDLFLFSYYALGMPFVDIAFLRKSQVKDGQITYLRHKTGQRITVHLEPCMEEIISSYSRSDSDYVFPIITAKTPDLMYKQYKSRLIYYNRMLKQLAEKAGISKNLTSYTPRHTWASVAYSSNVDLPVISKALGHTNTRTTLTYIKEINDDRLEKANRALVNRIL